MLPYPYRVLPGRFSVCLVFLLLMAPVSGFAQMADQILSEVDQRQAGLRSETSTIEVTDFDASGRTRSFTLKSYLDLQSENRNSLLVFLAPGSIRGTGLLTHVAGGVTQQWLYTPSSGHVEEITRTNKYQRFANTEFTCADFAFPRRLDFDFEILQATPDVWKIQALPKVAGPHSMVIFHVDRRMLMITRAEYYDAQQTRTRVLRAEDPMEVVPGIWRPAKLSAFNLVTNRRTVLDYVYRIFDDVYPGDLFTINGLRRGPLPDRN